MTTGYVERFKGKYTSDPNTVRVAGVSMYGGSAQVTLTASSLASTLSIPNTATIARINNSSTTPFVRLPQIQFIGQPLAVEIFGTGSTSTAVWITTNPSSLATFIGSSFNTLRSTANTTIELQATSSLNWAIMGIYSTGTSTGGPVNQSLAFSTST